MKSASQILNETRNQHAEGGAPVFKFTDPGDAIVATFAGRRTDVQTKSGNGPAKILDCNILASFSRGKNGPIGIHSVFESGHVSQLIEQHGLRNGDGFVLKYDSQDQKTRFKRFYFRRLSADELAELNAAAVSLAKSEEPASPSAAILTEFLETIAAAETIEAIDQFWQSIEGVVEQLSAEQRMSLIMARDLRKSALREALK